MIMIDMKIPYCCGECIFSKCKGSWPELECLFMAEKHKYKPIAIKEWDKRQDWCPLIESPTKKGHWIGNELGECSVCGHKGCGSDIWNGCKNTYCPNCGAYLTDK